METWHYVALWMWYSPIISIVVISVCESFYFPEDSFKNILDEKAKNFLDLVKVAIYIKPAQDGFDRAARIVVFLVFLFLWPCVIFLFYWKTVENT